MRNPGTSHYTETMARGHKGGWIGAAVAAGLAVAVTAATGGLRGVELPLRDAMVRTLPRRAPALVAAVVVDDPSLAAEGSWPWPRSRLADLVRAARATGARAVVLDVLLLEPRPGDDDLAAALRSVPSVLVATLDTGGARWLAPPPPLAGAGALAHGMFELDHDGVLRRLVSTKQSGDVALPAVAFAAAALATPGFPIPVARVVQPAFRASPRSVPAVSAADLLHGRAGEVLRGRVAFVGLAAAGLGDRVVTPVTRGPVPDPGVLVQAAVTEAIASGDLLHSVSPILAGGLGLVLVLAAGAVARLGGLRRLGGDALLVAAPLAAGFLLLRLADVVLPTATLALLGLLVVIALEAKNGFVAWRSAGAAGATLAAAAGGGVPSGRDSLEGRLGTVEELATAAALRRVADEEARRVMVHELRTPLTSVRGLGQMLRDLDLSPDEHRRATTLLVGETDRLQAMIEHLAELERLSRRPFDAAAAVDLSALVRDRAELLGRGHARTVVAEVAPGLHVRGDAGLLQRVLDNLLGNAFKFSPAGTAVEVRAFAAGSEVVIEVRDHGCGVPDGEKETIFRRFARGAAAEGTEGLGLGLALVREVLTWHGGRVTVADPDGGGSVFRVEIPAAREGGDGGEDPRRR